MHPTWELLEAMEVTEDTEVLAGTEVAVVVALVEWSVSSILADAPLGTSPLPECAVP